MVHPAVVVVLQECPSPCFAWPESEFQQCIEIKDDYVFNYISVGSFLYVFNL